MRGFDDLEDLIMRCIQRHLAGRNTERHGLVTSYDPENHLAKVMFMPEGANNSSGDQFESTWMPIETNHIGNGYGIAIGLTPGDGKSTGDQVIVRFQEGDIEGGKIVKVVHSDKDKPPTVQSGEMCFWTVQKDQQGNVQSQMRLFFDNQGQTRHEILDQDGNIKSSTVWNASSITHTTSNHSINAGNHTETVSNQISMNAQSGNRIESIGNTYLGLDQTGEKGSKKITQGGPAKKVWAKPA